MQGRCTRESQHTNCVTCFACTIHWCDDGAGAMMVLCDGGAGVMVALVQMDFGCYSCLN